MVNLMYVTLPKIIAVIVWNTKAVTYENKHKNTPKIWTPRYTIQMAVLTLLRQFHSRSVCKEIKQKFSLWHEFATMWHHVSKTLISLKFQP